MGHLNIVPGTLMKITELEFYPPKPAMFVLHSSNFDRYRWAYWEISDAAPGVLWHELWLEKGGSLMYLQGNGTDKNEQCPRTWVFVG